MNTFRYGALGALGLLATMAMTNSASAAECGSIKEAEMDWASAELMANVDKIILETGYGCDVELVPGSTNPTFTSMNEKGEPDIAPELWINSIREPLEKAYSEGRMHKLVDGPIEGTGEGWWVTRKFAEDHPDLDTVVKLIDHPELFPDVEDPSKGAFMGCPAGWGCQKINNNMFRAFKMEEKGWVLVDPGSAAGLDGAIAKAAERGEPWFGYYWAPTAIIGKYDLQMVPFGVEWGGDENWHDCLSQEVADCADPKPTTWIKSEVNTAVSDEFFKSDSPAIGYLKARVWPSKAMNGMLVYMSDNQATGEDAAYHFLETESDIWTKWVSPEVAEKVKAAL